MSLFAFELLLLDRRSMLDRLVGVVGLVGEAERALPLLVTGLGELLDMGLQYQ